MCKKTKVKPHVLCVFLSVFMVIFLNGCNIINEKIQLTAAEQLAEIEDRLFRESVTGDSISFNMAMKAPENFGLTPIEPTWGNYTREYFEEKCARNQQLMEELAEIDVNELSDMDDIILYQMLLQEAELSSRFEEYYYYKDPFNIDSGVYAGAPFILAEYTFRAESDIDAYITLLQIFDEFIQQQIAYEKEKSALGLFMPDAVLDQVIGLCEDMMQDTDQHFLLEFFDKRIDELDWLSDTQKAEYKVQNKQALTEHFFPVYETIITELSALRGTGGTINDAQREYYRLLLESYTSSDFSPEYIIELLDESIKHTYMICNYALMIDNNVALDLSNYSNTLSKGSLEDNMEYLKSIYTAIFPELPEHDLNLEVLPQNMSFASAYHLTPPADDYKNNVIRVNPNAEADIYTLAHEGYGGHLLQIFYERANGTGVLREMMSVGGYSEGFAEYGAERLLLSTDFDETLLQFAVNSTKKNIAMSARVEIGIYYEGWTPEDAARYLQRNLGIDRMTSEEIYNSCYATKYSAIQYAFGNAFFQKLREQAEAELGEEFNEKEYHTLLLEIGTCHLNILEEMLENKYAERRDESNDRDLMQ